MVCGQLSPEENCRPVRVVVWVKVRVSFRVEDKQTIAPEENCPPVRVRVWVRVSFEVWGAILLGSNCPRTLFFCKPTFPEGLFSDYTFSSYHWEIIFVILALLSNIKNCKKS